MTIRFATIEDIPALVEVGKKVHQLTRFKIYPYEEDLVQQQLLYMITQGQNGKGSYCLLVAVSSNHEIVGGLLGGVDRLFFSSETVANIIQYGTLPGKGMGAAGFKLLTAFRTWAMNRNAMTLYAGSNSGINIEKMDRFLKKLGFIPTGLNYVLPLNWPHEGRNLK